MAIKPLIDYSLKEKGSKMIKKEGEEIEFPKEKAVREAVRHGRKREGLSREFYATEQAKAGDLNYIYNGTITPTGGNKPYRIDVNKYVDEEGIHYPDRGGGWLRILSRQSFTYPCLTLTTKLPTLKEDRVIILDCTVGRHAGNGMGSFSLIDTDFFLRANKAGERTDLKLNDNLIPSDYDTDTNCYQLKISETALEGYINGELVGVILFGVKEGIPKWENSEPYAIGSHPRTLSRNFHFGVELNYRSVPNPEAFTFPLNLVSHERILMSNGASTPPRQYPLYKENTSTKWNGLATGGSVQTSHPVPIWGYPNKTLYFKSDASGTLDIEVYVGGGWEVYDSVSPTAGELETYLLSQEMQAPIMRCVYTPTDDDTINLAEVNLA